MSNNLLQKNIFYQNNKNNPDILVKIKNYENERKIAIFKKSNVTYNSITNNIPNNIINQKDLELTKDLPIDNTNHIIIDKTKERLEQEQQFKPIKQKIIINENNNDINNLSIQNFNELKVDQITFTNEQQNIINTNKNKYKNIISDLKILGILKKK